MPSRHLTDNEVDLVLTRLETLRDKALFLLGVKTGFRISELLSLHAEDVKGDTVTVRRKNMKGKHASRTVPLHSGAKALLTSYIDAHKISEGSILFPMVRQHAWRILNHAARSLGLSHVSTHSMRKTFGMKVYERTGKDVVAAQRALGHASLASTTKYLSVGQDIIDKAILSD